MNIIICKKALQELHLKKWDIYSSYVTQLYKLHSSLLEKSSNDVVLKDIHIALVHQNRITMLGFNHLLLT